MLSDESEQAVGACAVSAFWFWDWFSVFILVIGLIVFVLCNVDQLVELRRMQIV